MKNQVLSIPSYRVEAFENNVWRRMDEYASDEIAIANARSYSKSNKCDVRVIHKGEVRYLLVS
jgi:hypothetical protein